MDFLKDWWTSWSMDWPFLAITGKATGFDKNYAETIPVFFKDLEATDPELRRKYYDPQLYEVLMTMVLQRDTDSVRRLFFLCPGWNGRGTVEGLTPLGQALENRDWDCMALLLERGADPELYDQTTTALEAAIWDGLGEEVYRLLLSHGSIFTCNALLALAESEERDLIPVLLKVATVLQYDSLPGLLKAAEAEIRDNPHRYDPDTADALRRLCPEGPFGHF